MTRRGGSSPDAEVATLRRYLKEIGRYPPLVHEREIELARRIHEGDEDALRELVESNLRFVVAYAKRYRNVKFITYAVWWVRQAILHALAEHAGSFRLPQKQANTLYRMERIRSLLGERFGRAPTDDELSEELGISVDDVRVLTRASRSSLSLNEPVDANGDSELGDLLEQTGIPDTDELLLRESFTTRALSDALSELPERERRVLELRFGLIDDQPKTLREIGEIMDLSRERVRQIESRALNKLRRSHKKHSLAGFLR